MPGKKTIVVVILACILGAIVLFVNQRPSTLDLDDSNTSLKTENSPDTVTKSFYAAYIMCRNGLNQPPENQGLGSTNCQNHTEFTTQAFLENLNASEVANIGADPITCSLNLPDTTTIGNTQTNGDSSVVYVREAWGELETKLEVQLIYENNKWLINNIVCPSPLVN